MGLWSGHTLLATEYYVSGKITYLLFSDMQFACSSKVAKVDWLTCYNELISSFRRMLFCLSVSNCRFKGANYL